MNNRIDIHIRANHGVPTELLVALGKVFDKYRPGAMLDGACDCCNFHMAGGEE